MPENKEVDKFIESLEQMSEPERKKALEKIQAKYEELKNPVGYTPEEELPEMVKHIGKQLL